MERARILKANQENKRRLYCAKTDDGDGLWVALCTAMDDQVQGWLELSRFSHER